MKTFRRYLFPFSHLTKSEGGGRYVIGRMRFALSILTVFGFAACEKKEGGDVRLEPPLVKLVSAQPGKEEARAFTGVVSAKIQSNVGFRVPGKITERLVDAGTSVRENQVLYRLDTTDLLNEVANREAAVQAARARLVQTKADEARHLSLLEAKAISVQEYDRAKADNEGALSALEAAEAQAEMARNNNLYAELRAAADGVVVETMAEPGQVVAAGQAVIKLAHSGPREATIDLPESIRPALGSKATAILYAGVSSSFPAHLRQLSEAADPVTRTFEARYVLDGAAAQAPLGATVTIYLAENQTTNELRIPNSALGDFGQGPGIWLWDEAASSVSFRPVHILRIGEESTIIKGDLPAGAQIIAQGANLLHEGQKVRIEKDRLQLVQAQTEAK